MTRLAMLVFSILATSVASSQDLLSVRDWSFSTGLNGREPATRITEFKNLNPPLYFWTLIEGSEEAWKRLEAEKKLPIYHRWVRHAAAGSNELIPDLANTDISDLISETPENISTDLDPARAESVITFI